MSLSFHLFFFCGLPIVFGTQQNFITAINDYRDDLENSKKANEA